MNHNPNDLIACIDIDGTLVKVANEGDPGVIYIRNPYTGIERARTILMPNVNLLLQYKAQGYFIRVWSHGGSLWAKAVVEALSLEDVVDSVEAKPSKLVDDLPVEQGVGKTIFVHED